MKQLAAAESVRERFSETPGVELTRALALGTWYSFWSDYGAIARRVDLDDWACARLREAMATNHEAATDYLMRLAAAHGIDGTPLHHAGVICRYLAKHQELRDPEARTHLWPKCLGQNRYALPQGQQDAIEAGERVIQTLRLKLATAAEPAKRTDDLGPLEHALALLVKHPDWSDTRIAETVKVSRQTLYKPAWSRYRAARAVLKSGKADIPRGSKDEHGNLEAWDGDTFGDTES